MKKSILILLIGITFFSCNSVKKNQQYIAQGDYNKAIELAVKKLQKDKSSSKSEEHILLLEEAFSKAVEQDQRDIEIARKGSNPAAAQIIYRLLLKLENRQKQIRPLLPLYSKTSGKKAKFKMVNYSGKIALAQKDYVGYLYEIGNSYLELNNTLDARNAYNSFKELDEIHPDFNDTRSLLDEAYFQGTDFVLVSLQNHTYTIIPQDLENILLNFNTSELDDFWTVYHRLPKENINYNYGINLDFTNIEFSPERISEKDYNRTNRIKEGWEYQKDRNGNYVLDEDGNKIKKDIYISVAATVTETIQTKSVIVEGIVVATDFQKNNELYEYPLTSEFIFENVFSTFQGDQRALYPEDQINIKNHFIYFPSNDQLFIDGQEGIKIQLFEIISDNKLRK